MVCDILRKKKKGKDIIDSLFKAKGKLKYE